jgi:hypothetical protein
MSLDLYFLLSFVEQSSTIERYCHPPPKKKLEMIASNLACFIKQFFYYKEQRKMIQASHSAMSMDTYHLSKQGCCTNQTNIFI